MAKEFDINSSLNVSGDVSAVNISASKFYGDGSNLTSLGGDGSNITNLGGGTVLGDLVVAGDFSVGGTSTTINTENLTVQDNIITLNSGLTGSLTPIDDAGIEVLRGSEPKGILQFNETTNTWQVGVSGNVGNVLTVKGDYSPNQFAVFSSEDGSISGSPNLTLNDNLFTMQGSISASVLFGDGSKLTGITDRLFEVNEQTLNFERIQDGALNTSTTPFNIGLPKNTFPVDASSVEAGWDKYAIFDGDTSTWNGGWESEESSSLPQWISVKVLMSVNKYRFFTFSSNYGPTDWELQGRYKGGSWQTLDTRATQTTVSGWTPYYTFVNDADYDEHRLYITGIDPASPFGTVRIHELELIDNKKVLDVKSSEFDRDFIPAISGAYDLGSVTHPWKDLYLTDNSIYLGDDIISVSGGELQVNGQKVITENDSNIATTGNISAGAFYGDGSNLTGVSIAAEEWFPANVNVGISGQGAPGTDDEWRDIAYGNGQFVAIGSSAVATSVDGVIWDQGTISNGSWVALAFGDGLFMTVKPLTPIEIGKSTNGINWDVTTPSEFPTNTSARDIAYGQGKFVMVFEDQNKPNLAVSEDLGETWTTYNFGTNTFRKVIYANGIWMAVGLDYSTFQFISYTSTDAVTWSRNVLNENGDTFQPQGLAYGKGKFVCSANQVSDYYLASSEDGINWTYHDQLDNNDNYRGLFYGGGKFVATGQDSDTIAISDDGEVWTRPNTSALNASSDWTSGVYEDGIWVVVGTLGTRLAYSGAKNKISNQDRNINEQFNRDVLVKGNISGSAFFGDGSNLSNVIPDTDDVTIELASDILRVKDGGISTDKLASDVDVITTGNITANTIQGDGSNITGIISTEDREFLDLKDWPTIASYEIALSGSGSYIVPAGVYFIEAVAFGGGGGGGGAAHGNYSCIGGGGGAAGQWNWKTFEVTPGQSISYSCGTGGNGGTSSTGFVTGSFDVPGMDGQNGSNTTFSSLTALGGEGGVGAGAWGSPSLNRSTVYGVSQHIGPWEGKGLNWHAGRGGGQSANYVTNANGTDATYTNIGSVQGSYGGNGELKRDSSVSLVIPRSGTSKYPDGYSLTQGQNGTISGGSFCSGGGGGSPATFARLGQNSLGQGGNGGFGIDGTDGIGYASGGGGGGSNGSSIGRAGGQGSDGVILLRLY